MMQFQSAVEFAETRCYQLVVRSFADPPGIHLTPEGIVRCIASGAGGDMASRVMVRSTGTTTWLDYGMAISSAADLSSLIVPMLIVLPGAAFNFIGGFDMC